MGSHIELEKKVLIKCEFHFTERFWLIVFNIIIIFTANSEGTDELRKVQLDTVSRKVCEKSYASEMGSRQFPRNISQNLLCAGVMKGGKDTCQVGLPWSQLMKGIEKFHVDLNIEGRQRRSVAASSLRAVLHVQCRWSHQFWQILWFCKYPGVVYKGWRIFRLDWSWSLADFE